VEPAAEVTMGAVMDVEEVKEVEPAAEVTMGAVMDVEEVKEVEPAAEVTMGAVMDMKEVMKDTLDAQASVEKSPTAQMRSTKYDQSAEAPAEAVQVMRTEVVASAERDGRGWTAMSTTLSSASKALLAEEKDSSVVDIEDAVVEDEAKEVGWGDLLLRLLDIGLFVTEEVVKLVVAATPAVSEMVFTAADRATKALGDGSTGGSNKLRSLQRPEDDGTPSWNVKQLASGEKSKEQAASVGTRALTPGPRP